MATPEEQIDRRGSPSAVAQPLLVGLLLKFSPLGSAMTFVGMGGMDPGAAQEQLKEGLEEMMRSMQR